MSTTIIYRTKHGATEKNALLMKKHLSDEKIDTFNLKEHKPDLNNYDTIIIGGSIHAGILQGKIRKFCKKNKKVLLEKPLGIFLTCMDEGPETEIYFTKNFEPELLDHAKEKAILGGEFNFEKMNFIEKSIIKKISGFTKTVSKIDENKVAEFAKKMS